MSSLLLCPCKYGRNAVQTRSSFSAILASVVELLLGSAPDNGEGMLSIVCAVTSNDMGGMGMGGMGGMGGGMGGMGGGMGGGENVTEVRH